MSGNTNAVASLRRKYNNLLGVALTLQNLLDDVATQLERLHACITWQDPSATLLFIGFCACAAMALALLGLPTVMAAGLFWMVSAHMYHFSRCLLANLQCCKLLHTAATCRQSSACYALRHCTPPLSGYSKL